MYIFVLENSIYVTASHVAIYSSLPNCAQQLRKALATNRKLGPAHLHTSPHGKPPSSLVPPDLTANQASFVSPSLIMMIGQS